MGVMGGAKYTNQEITLGPGDSINVYSDGVNEAMSVNREQFGNDKLIETVGKIECADPKCTVETIMAEVKKHAEGAQQSDDITIVSLLLKSLKS